ncbi:MAG: helicase C-terminal domain-containing protein, partial [Oceanobacter sp.]
AQFVSATGMPPSIMHSLREAPEQCQQLISHLNLLWPMSMDLLGDRDRERFEFGRIPDSLRDLLNNLKAPLQPLLQGLDKLNDLLQESLDDKNEGEFSRDIAESWHGPIGLMLARAEAMWEALTWLAAEEKEGELPVARWLSRMPFGEDWDIKLSASPIAIGDQLRRTLWWRCHGSVVTSATLTALNSFGKLSWEAGLPDWADFHRVASPFNYPELGSLEVVQLASDPKSENFQQDVENWMRDNIDLEAGTLMLFSSRAQLEATRDTFIRDWYEKLLCQGFLPKSEIVRRHKERIDKGEGSLIFGLASFAEGIDLPGDYLTHVVIVKIPFAVPDDPIQAATSEWIESRGRNSFMDLTLPAASIRLVQACGRLIRKEDDQGKVSILDKRLSSHRYGRALLEALPPLKRI